MSDSSKVRWTVAGLVAIAMWATFDQTGFYPGLGFFHWIPTVFLTVWPFLVVAAMVVWGYEALSVLRRIEAKLDAAKLETAHHGA